MGNSMDRPQKNFSLQVSDSRLWPDLNPDDLWHAPVLQANLLNLGFPASNNTYYCNNKTKIKRI
jgi:hypothetical protein